jgi:hypothetical protein
MPDKPKYRADCIVFLSILILLAAGDLLSHGAWGRWAAEYGLRLTVLQYFWTAVLGLMVGFAELVSRYRDEPWRVAILPPGLVVTGLNGLARCFALFLLQTFPTELHAPSTPVPLVMLAGFGAMVVIRTKLLTVHQPGGTDVAVGPAFILDTMLSAINRDVDRRRALQRTARVAASGLISPKHPASSVAAFLIRCRRRVQQNIPLDPDLLDQVELPIEEVHMVLLAFQDVQEKIARHEIADTLAIRYASPQIVERLRLKPQIGTQDFLDRLTDRDLVQPLHVWQPIKKQDALDQLVRMLHFVD